MLTTNAVRTFGCVKNVERCKTERGGAWLPDDYFDTVVLDGEKGKVVDSDRADRLS